MKALLILFLLMVATAGQATEIVVEPTRYASQISGTVMDPTGAPISGVSVELVPCGISQFTGHFLAQEKEVARTGKDGRFIVRDWRHDLRTCLSFSREGFNYHQFELKYKPGAGSLVVKLSIAA